MIEIEVEIDTEVPAAEVQVRMKSLQITCVLRVHSVLLQLLDVTTMPAEILSVHSM